MPTRGLAQEQVDEPSHSVHRSTAIYTYTPELYPTEVRATGMGIASAWGRLGCITMLLLFGVLLRAQSKALLFIVSDAILGIAFVAVARFGPSTRGLRLEDSAVLAAR